MVDFDPPDPVDPKKKKKPSPAVETDHRWEAWANSDSVDAGSRPLPGEAEYVGRPDPPMTRAQKERIAAIVVGTILLVLVFFGINFAIGNKLENSDTASHKEAGKQSAQASAEAELKAEEAVTEQDHAASLPDHASQEADLADIGATIKVVGLGKQRVRDPELDRITATIKIVPLPVSPVAVPLPATATQ